MAIEQDLAEWAQARPEWQRDVLVRLCRFESFGDPAIAAIADALVSGRASTTVAISASDIPGNAVSAEPVRLHQLRDIQGVNALAGNQRLSFAAVGLTVIYGDNASGKSGYARILRNAVAARVCGDVLGNVFAAGAVSDMTAMIEFTVGGRTPAVEWKWPGENNPELAQVHYYDADCGNSYLSTSSEISYRPSALVLLDQLVTVCDAVRSVLDEYLRVNFADKPDLPGLPVDTKAAKFLATLKATTRQDAIDAVVALPDNSGSSLGALLQEEARLKASDPTEERSRLIELSSNLSVVVNLCEGLASALSSMAIAELGDKRTKARQLRAAATMASLKDFDAEPVKGVGSVTWRALWQAACIFSQTEAYHDHGFPATDGGSRCVLCQQVLLEDGAQRLQRFHAFMTDTTERDALTAEEELASSRRSLVALRVVPAVVTAAISRVRAVDTALADTIDAWLQLAAARINTAVEWIDDPENAELTVLVGSPVGSLKQRADEVRAEAVSIDATSFATSLQHISTQARELQATTALAAGVEAVRQEIARLGERAKIEAAKRQTDTGVITRKSTELTKEHVTRLVRDRFTRETELLKLRRITLDPTSGKKGSLLHKPTLLGASSAVSVMSVLSNGEQSALGLAGFITEVEFDETKSAIVLDDPVTSLDHIRRSRVAQRLVDLAKDRQVVVFTHEVTFVGDLVKHAGEAHVAIAERWIQRQGDQAGICADKHPWKAKDVASRLHDLQAQLDRIGRDRSSLDQETYEDRCRLWGGGLSETWERAINLEIVYEVVDRGTSQVRPKKFRILVAITQQDDEEFQAGYARSSEWAPRHDKDPEINIVAPEPDEMQTELDRLKTWFARVKRYSN